MDIQVQIKNLSLKKIGSVENVRQKNPSSANITRGTPQTLTKSPSNIIINEEDVMGQIAISAFNVVHKFNFASFTTASHLTIMTCKKFGIKCSNMFGLKRMRTYEPKGGKKVIEKTKIWLSDDKPIFSQGCDSSTTLYLHHKYWFQEISEIEDAATAEYIYKETAEKIVGGVYPCLEDDLVQLAAIQLHIEDKVSQFKQSTLDNLKEYIPKYAIEWHSLAEWIQLITIFVEKVNQSNLEDLHRRYLEFAASRVPYITTQFFPAEYATKEMSKTIPVLIGLSPSGMGIYEMMHNSRPVLQVFHKYSDLESCEVKPSATSAPKKRMSSVKPEITVTAEASSSVTVSMRNIAIEEQVTPGPIKFLLIVSTTKKAMKKIRFQVSTFVQNDTCLVNFINKYQESSDQLLYKMEMEKSKTKEEMITVQLVDGTLAKKIRITADMTGSNLVDVFCNKIGIKDSSFFQIAVLEDGLYRWLSLKDHVLIQSVHANSVLVLRLRFFCQDISQITDPTALHLYYLQISDQVHKGEIIAKPDIASKLVALELQAFSGDYEEKRKKNIIATLSRYVPPKLLGENTKQFGKAVIKEYIALKSMSKEAAEALYLKICSELPTFGLTFFPVVIPRVSENAFLGVSLHGATLFNSEMEFVGHYRFGYELRSWINSGQTMKFTVKESRNADEKVGIY